MKNIISVITLLTLLLSSTNKERYINKYGGKYESAYNLALSLSFDDNPIIVISE
ncbi:MAG: hypothetical protein LBL58_06670 [Tannerellaceae bacterium]|nr:hypothetical protein [Tannerellaceae bacterium]